MTSNWLHKKDLMWENFNSSSHGSYYSYFIHTYWLFTWNRRAGGIFKRKRTKLLTDFALRLALICYSNRCLKVLFQCTKSTAIQTLVFCSWIRRMQIRPQWVWYLFETCLCSKVWVKKSVSFGVLQLKKFILKLAFLTDTPSFWELVSYVVAALLLFWERRVIIKVHFLQSWQF